MKLISEALVKAQKQFRPVVKDAENPFFKSSYADLSSILTMVMPILTSNGLALSQPMRVENGITILCTKLIHESGECLSSEMILPLHQDPQKFGSLITYYKRYQLQAMLGISTADEDDDANKVSEPMQRNTFNPRTSEVADRPASDKQKEMIKKNYPGLDVSNLSMKKASELIQASMKGK
jgi:hypothetical protein